MTLLTNGTVREARGFTSRMNTCPPWMANWMFIRPMTRSSRASATVWRRTSSSSSAGIECGGSEQALSPECTPARSMCSMMPATTIVSPSLIASTSSSIASSRNWSTRTGRPGPTSAVRSM